MKRVVSVAGARPNFMKVASVERALRAMAGVEHAIVHTGQHYDAAMSDAFFRDLGLSPPAAFLGVGPGSHAVQTGRIMIEIEKAFLALRPDFVIVVGDVNSTMAGALVATKLGIPVGHVEAGLRSFDRAMPEEINRIATDAVADYAFVTERSAIENLTREGWRRERIHLVGNTMIDTLVAMLPAARESRALEEIGVRPGEYALVTFHRPSNVDEPERLREIFDVLRNLSREIAIVFPVHPRTDSRLKELGLSDDRIHLVPPLPYLSFLALMAAAKIVITDSGGVQEETTYLGIPCITARTTTERPITCEVGTNRLCPPEGAALERMAREALAHPPPGSIPELWDGRAGERIAALLASILEAR